MIQAVKHKILVSRKKLLQSVLLLCIVSTMYGQTNLNFETGTTVGWTISGSGGCSITSGAGMDAVTGAFPVVYPDGGSYSLMLANGPVANSTDGWATQTFVVTNNNSCFTYNYAAVLQSAGHACNCNPYLQVTVTVNGTEVPCTSFQIVEGCSSIPGWTTINYPTGNVSYKPWSSFSYDLRPYIGQTAIVTFGAVDCCLGGHFGYAYLDCSSQPMGLSLNGASIPDGQTANYLCVGVNNILCAPPGFQYSWSGPGVNGNTGQCVTPTSSGSYSVALSQPDLTCGAPFLLSSFTYAFPPVATFIVSNACVGVGLNISNTSNDTSGGTVTGYNWDFGNNGSYDSQNAIPNYAFNTAGTQPIKLVVENNFGCKDSVVNNVQIFENPVVSFSLQNACPNSSITISNTSNITAPDNITSYNWTFGIGALPTTTSTQQTPTGLNYNSSGVQTVSLTLTSNNSCTATATQTVMINPQPVASFSTTSVCAGLTTMFTDLSTPTGSITNWAWDFTNDGTTDNQTANPTNVYTTSGTFTANLIITTFGNMKRNKLLARYIALAVRNSEELEELHSGISPSSKTGDYSDVKVVTPFGEIEWNEVSRISDKEMRKLMINIEQKIYNTLEHIPKLEKKAGSPKTFEKLLQIALVDNNGASWDLPEEEMIKRYGADYKVKLKISE